MIRRFLDAALRFFATFLGLLGGAAVVILYQAWTRT